MSTPAMSVTADPAARLARGLLWLLVAAVGLLAVTGGVLARGVIDQEPVAAAPPPDRGFRVADDVPVSFGVVAVEHVKKVPGLSKRSVASADHGIPGFVGQAKAELDLSITMRNTTKRPVAYDPSFFRVRLGRDGAVLKPSGASIGRGRLEPGATLDGTLRYVVPKRRTAMQATFRDPGTRSPVVIDLGRPAAGAPSVRSQPAKPAAPASDGHPGH